MKKYFNYFIYASLIFLIIALYKLDYLIIPKIYNYYYLTFSILLVLAGFFIDAISWYKILVFKGYKANLIQAITSMGLSVFGKYIPGKLWVVLGRSAYIAKHKGESEKELGAISLIAQFLSLWTGAIVGFLVLIVLPVQKSYLFIIITIIGIVLFTTILYLRYVHDLFDYLIKKIFKSNFVIPRLLFKETLKIVHWYFLTWICWSTGFYLLVNSLTIDEVSFFSGFSFPLAGTVGLVAVFVPGGLGVRESIITGILVLLGITLSSATAISVVGRLWFMVGEFCIFIFSILHSYITRRRKKLN
ncbi:lysylphosphatidylglycerol synthase domain-containing protein [Bacteroidota bacterium]